MAGTVVCVLPISSMCLQTPHTQHTCTQHRRTCVSKVGARSCSKLGHEHLSMLLNTYLQHHFPQMKIVCFILVMQDEISVKHPSLLKYNYPEHV